VLWSGRVKISLRRKLAMSKRRAAPDLSRAVGAGNRGACLACEAVVSRETS
jgi:hypothetical protein